MKRLRSQHIRFTRYVSYACANRRSVVAMLCRSARFSTMLFAFLSHKTRVGHRAANAFKTFLRSRRRRMRRRQSSDASAHALKLSDTITAFCIVIYVTTCTLTPVHVSDVRVTPVQFHVVHFPIGELLGVRGFAAQHARVTGARFFAPVLVQTELQPFRVHLHAIVHTSVQYNISRCVYVSP